MLVLPDNDVTGIVDSLPVITLSDPQRMLRDGEYASSAAIQLLDYIDRIKDLRGTGRLFVP